MSELTVCGAVRDGETVGVRCRDGRIAEIGPGVEPEPGDRVLEANGDLLVAPLVNGHTHAAMTLFRGYGGDLPLMRWLEEKVWPVEAKLDAEDVYWGTRLACLEMVRSGTTRFWDMYWQPRATARAVEDSGLRANVGGPLFDAGADGGQVRERALEDLDALQSCGPLIERSLAPHSIYAAGEELLRWTAEIAGERGVAIQIHLSETEDEVRGCIERHGVRPAGYLDRVGLLGERTVLAHGVWLDDDELDLIAERGATVVTNPVANMKLAVGGVFPYRRARRAGVAVGLGTDGAGSNDSLDLLADLKAFALIQRHATADATAVAAKDAWGLATGQMAPALGADTDPLRPGQPADFLLLRATAPELAIGELEAALVYAAAGAAIDSTVVAGRVLMEHGEVPGAEEVVARAAERVRRLGIGV